MSVTKKQEAAAVSNVVSLGDTDAGNLLVARIGASADVTGVTDGAGHTWTKATDLYNAGNAIALDIWYTIANGGTPSNITAANGFSASFCHIHAAEYSSTGTWELDKVASFDTGGTSTATFDSGATATTTQAEELLCGMECNLSSVTATWTQPTTELYDDTSGGSGRSLSVADEVTTGTGTFKATGTLSSSVSAWMAGIATFKCVAGGGGAVVPVFMNQYRQRRA